MTLEKGLTDKIHNDQGLKRLSYGRDVKSFGFRLLVRTKDVHNLIYHFTLSSERWNDFIELQEEEEVIRGSINSFL